MMKIVKYIICFAFFLMPLSCRVPKAVLVDDPEVFCRKLGLPKSFSKNCEVYSADDCRYLRISTSLNEFEEEKEKIYNHFVSEVQIDSIIVKNHSEHFVVKNSREDWIPDGYEILERRYGKGGDSLSIYKRGDKRLLIMFFGEPYGDNLFGDERSSQN